MRRLGWLIVALAVVVTVALEGQDAPQEHRTAVVTLTNGTLTVFSIDSGGVRHVVVQAGHTTVDSAIGYPRGGRWTRTVEEIELVVPMMLAGLDALAAGKRALDPIRYDYTSGPVVSITIRCLSSGCTASVVNRTSSGTTRAGTWTSNPRLPLDVVRTIVLQVLEAARHETGAVFVWPE